MRASNKALWLVVIPGLCIALTVVGASHASSVAVPHNFVSGTPALASEVNQNFAAVQTAVNDNDSRITGIETALGGLAANELARAHQAVMTGFVDNFGPLSRTDIFITTPTVPTNGILLIWGQMQVEYDNSNPGGETFAATFNLAVDGNMVGPPLQEAVTDPVAGTGQRVVSLFAAAPVTSGTPTISLQGLTPVDGANLVFIDEASLMTLFVPFGNSGTQGLLN